jgi:methionyl-tRNA formyltransferase
MNYCVATIKTWNIENFDKLKPKKDWHLITAPKDYDLIRQLKPRYVFFPHWSWMLPRDIFENYECVIFHMTDLPFGRGAEPLQHLIMRGLKETKVSAIRCAKDVDSGDIYMKKPMSLDGSAGEIYKRCSDIVYKMIKEIASKELKAEIKQEGEPVFFAQRNLENCRIPITDDLNIVYDIIRAQDAETYQPAFMEKDKLRLEFTEASLKNGYIESKVRIKIKNG